MHPMLNTAVKAARRAGNIINRATRNLDVVAVKEKAANDFVSEVDREAERAIISTLHEAYPGHAILAEESGASGTSEHRWIIDPLDGTTNFLHGVPHFAISIGLERDGEIIAGVIYQPISDELFWAEKGNGAFIDTPNARSRRLRVSGRKEPARALVGTGIPHLGKGDHANYVRKLEAVMGRTSGVRRWGAAALDLAFVAAGRYDAFFEIGLAPWDVAAGILLVREAGGMISDISGAPYVLGGPSILATNAGLRDVMVEILA